MFSMGWVYELPWLKERKDAVGYILGGWQVNGVFAAFTGRRTASAGPTTRWPARAADRS